uniref:Uncharacterized protein n=1 Tax=Candidatus Kentrum sp. MB TaxID=2138164 RepID=A0A450XS64_9GAMM|nr:MAG: hypothetical protein BECKMB1821G_GA0114241_11029 [Candidatus Kentron sp. MB]
MESQLNFLMRALQIQTWYYNRSLAESRKKLDMPLTKPIMYGYFAELVGDGGKILEINLIHYSIRIEEEIVY